MRKRSNRGTTIAEMPLALWIILMICFCCLILCTETIRFGFFWNACREAAQQAAKCQTFLVNSSVPIVSQCGNSVGANCDHVVHRHHLDPTG